MEFKEENFALYQLLDKLNQPGVDAMRRDFIAARDGDDDDKYQFALGIYGMATAPGIERFIPLTPAIKQATLEQSYAIFEDVGSRNHPTGALMVAFCKSNASGTAEDKAGAKAWLDKAEALGGKSEFSEALRQQITTVTLAATRAPKTPGQSS